MLLPHVDYVDVGDPYNIGFSLQSRVIVNLGEIDDLFTRLLLQDQYSRKILKVRKGVSWIVHRVPILFLLRKAEV